MTDNNSNQNTESTQADQPGNRRARTIFALVLSGGVLAAGGYALVSATTAGASAPGPSGSSSSPSSGSSSAPSSTAPPSGACPTPPKPGSGADVDGTLTAVGSNSITVRDLSGTTRTFALTSGTTVHEGPGQKISASALATGEHVHVRGTGSSGSYTATDVDVRLASIDGTVRSIGSSSFTVVDRDGFTRTIVTDASTAYRSGNTSAQRSSLAVGDAVHAQGTVDANGTSLDASSVSELAAGSGPAGKPVMGAMPAGPKAGGPGASCAPAGMPEAPSDAPKGAAKAPSGAPKAPTGAPAAPSGAPKAPSGAPKAPSGAAKAPTGAPAAPTGAAKAPGGAAKAPSGAPAAPSGAPKAPAVPSTSA